LVGGNCPDEAGELAGAGDDDLLVGLAARRHSLPALAEALLAAPGALDDERVLAALAAGELVADFGPSACVPGCFDEQATDVAVADLGDRALPTTLAEERSDGTRPTKAMNSSALAKNTRRAAASSPRQRPARRPTTTQAHRRRTPAVQRSKNWCHSSSRC
jgi:hypothetical protein